MTLISFKPKDAILSVIVTHNRLNMTKLTLDSYLATANEGNYLVVVDNNSGDETEEYLAAREGHEIDKVIYNGENKYPGAAINQGWEEGLKAFPEATLLHRSDNDIFYRYAWDVYAFEAFKNFPELGLFGLIELSEYFFYSYIPQIVEEKNDIYINKHLYDIGGACVMRRELWDQGLRYDEGSWASGAEDHKMTTAVMQSEYVIAHATVPLAIHLGVATNYRPGHEDFLYYKKTVEDRGGLVVDRPLDPEQEQLVEEMYGLRIKHED